MSITSAYFKAESILSIDLDWSALLILKENIQKLGLQYIISPLCADIRNVQLSRNLLPVNLKITTIMNPPFGVQTKTADRSFLVKAFSFSDVIYSIHLSNKKTRIFFADYVRKFKWRIDNIIPFNMVLENTFPFHNQKTKKIEVDLYRFLKGTK